MIGYIDFNNGDIAECFIEQYQLLDLGRYFLFPTKPFAIEFTKDCLELRYIRRSTITYMRDNCRCDRSGMNIQYMTKVGKFIHDKWPVIEAIYYGNPNLFDIIDNLGGG